MVGMSALATLLVLLCMDILNAWHFKLGDRTVNVTLASKEERAIVASIETLGKKVDKFFLNKKDDVYRVEIVLRVPKKESSTDLIKRLNALEGVQLESME